jgi:hypothetical protein
MLADAGDNYFTMCQDGSFVTTVASEGGALGDLPEPDEPDELDLELLPELDEAATADSTELQSSLLLVASISSR